MAGQWPAHHGYPRHTHNQRVASFNLLAAQFVVLKGSSSHVDDGCLPTDHFRHHVGDQRRVCPQLIVLFGNRDESVFPNADDFIIDRPNARAHVAFGFGVHRCMGNRLAEMQLRILWEEILQRFHKVEVVGDVVRLPNNFIRGIKDVPVRLIPG